MRACVAACTLVLPFASDCVDSLPPSGGPELYADTPLVGCEAAPGPLALRCPVTDACDLQAIPPDRIRVVTWNIKVGLQRGLAAVGDTLHALDPDLVLLQEVDRGTQRAQAVDQPKELARILGDKFDYVFAPALLLEGGSYGLVALSRLRFQSAGPIALSNTDSGEPRAAIDMTVCLGPSSLRLINHHADYQTGGATSSCREILGAVLESPQGPTVIAGDLNQQPDDPGPVEYVQAGLHDVFAQHDSSPTFGDKRIDYIFVDSQLAGQVSDAKVVQTDVSDHELLVMDLATRQAIVPR